MVEEKGVTSVQWDCTPDTSDAATFMSLWDNGFILRNAGEYLSLFEVSQFLTTCKEWKRMFKSKIEPIKVFWQAAAARVYGSKITDNPQWRINSLRQIRCYNLALNHELTCRRFPMDSPALGYRGQTNPLKRRKLELWELGNDPCKRWKYE